MQRKLFLLIYVIQVYSDTSRRFFDVFYQA